MGKNNIKNLKLSPEEIKIIKDALIHKLASSNLEDIETIHRTNQLLDLLDKPVKNTWFPW
jgi:hypothetical protein